MTNNKEKSNKIKVYKFRALSSDKEFSRAKQIIETGCFWCSNFWELNDPMEGVYSNSNISPTKILKIFEGKSEHKICSFSGSKALRKPSLWGYYANGCKGLVIEIEVEESKVKAVNYISQKQFKNDIDDVKEILSRKWDDWKLEDEFRFLVKSDNNFHKIGEITKVYFGNPYDGLNNTPVILNKSKDLSKFNELKKELIKVCEAKDILTNDINF